jgi:cell division protein FtsB
VEESKEKALSESMYNTVMASMAMSKWKLKGDFYVKELVDVVKKRDDEIEDYKAKNNNLEKMINNYNNNLLAKIYKKIRREKDV